jgi:uncharacterized protein with GYD domain
VDRYIFLLKLVGKFGSDADIAGRLRTILDSLEKTLRGKLISLHGTMGEYDFVAIVDIPKDQDPTIFSCLKALRAPGDVELTILRAFEYRQIYPELPQKY